MSETLMAPAAGNAPRKATREEYAALPEGPPHYELIAGETVKMTSPFREHQHVLRVLIRLWDTYLVTGPGGELTLEPNLYLPTTEDVYIPDLVYVTEAHAHICRREGIFGTPHVICEILSPSTQGKDRHVKLEEYRRAGVAHVWLIEPSAPVAVEEYRLHDEGEYRVRIHRSPGTWEPQAFPGWRIPLADFDAAVAPRLAPE